MQIFSNRYVFTGLSVALITVFFAISGAPRGFEEFSIPVWDILLQFNLCSGLVFVVLGVLESVETPTPDLRPALQLLLAAFVSFGMACALNAASVSVSPAIQLFLFAFSLACLAAGWARIGLTVLRQLDAQE